MNKNLKTSISGNFGNTELGFLRIKRNLEKNRLKMEKRGKMDKKAQLTIFIIIALVIVAVLLILFYPRLKILVTGPTTLDYVKDCTEEAAEEALEKITMQAQ